MISVAVACDPVISVSFDIRLRRRRGTSDFGGSLLGACSDIGVERQDLAIYIPQSLVDSLVGTVRQIFPTKAFGYFVSDTGRAHPTDFVLFHDNHRNNEDWKPRFESYGEYFVAHSDAGFVASPEESLRIQKLLWERGLCEVGVFHSHQRHPANFSQIDYDLHIERFAHLWHLIISMRNPKLPQIRAFDVSADGVQEVPIFIPDGVPAEHAWDADA